jgi:hypothetical protein
MTLARTLLLFVALALCGVGAGYVAYNMSGRSHGSPGEGPRITASFERLNLAVPSAYFRSGPPRDIAGDRIDLVAAFPDFAAAGTAAARSDPDALVFIAISRNDGAPDPAERPQAIYGGFLEPDAWQNPGGLVMRRFAATSPYAEEELFLAPPDGRQFSARCRKAEGVAPTIGETCLWRLRIDGADVQARFSPALLPRWETLERGLRQLVESWRQR